MRNIISSFPKYKSNKKVQGDDQKVMYNAFIYISD